MKKSIGFFAIAILLASCENVKIDEAKIDSAGAKLQKSVQTTADTVVSKVGKWADSLRKDDDTLSR